MASGAGAAHRSKVIVQLAGMGYESVRAVENPLTSLADDAERTRKMIAQQNGPALATLHRIATAMSGSIHRDAPSGYRCSLVPIPPHYRDRVATLKPHPCTRPARRWQQVVATRLLDPKVGSRSPPSRECPPRPRGSASFTRLQCPSAVCRSRDGLAIRTLRGRGRHSPTRDGHRPHDGTEARLS
jgi:hypothetical protein